MAARAFERLRRQPLSGSSRVAETVDRLRRHSIALIHQNLRELSKDAQLSATLSRRATGGRENVAVRSDETNETLSHFQCSKRSETHRSSFPTRSSCVIGSFEQSGTRG